MRGRWMDELVVEARGGTLLVVQQELVLFGGRESGPLASDFPEEIRAALTPAQLSRSDLEYAERTFCQGDEVTVTATVQPMSGGGPYRADARADFVVCPEREPTVVEYRD